MSAVTHKLQLHYTHFPHPVDTVDGRTWVFDQQLEKQNRHFFLPLLHQQQCIRIEFEVLQTQLTDLINSEADLAVHEDKLVTALMLAEILQYQYRYYLGVKREAEYFQIQSQSLRIMLKNLGYIFPERDFANPQQLSEWYISTTINKKTNQGNLLRQIVQRSRNFVVKLDRLVNSTATNSTIDKIDHTVSPIIKFYMLLLFIPRTVSNLWILGKHVLPGAWMEEKERSLGWQDRLHIQLKRRGFQLGDDLVWFVVNVSICFITVGPLSHWAMPMLMGQQIIEVFCRAAKAIVEVAPLIELRNHYLSLLKKNDLDKSGKLEIKHYLAYLDNRIDHEIKNLTLSVINSTTILVLTMLALSLFSAYPLIPIISSGMIVAVTLIYYALTKNMNHNPPYKHHAIENKAKQLGLFSVTDHQTDFNDSHKPVNIPL